MHILERHLFLCFYLKDSETEGVRQRVILSMNKWIKNQNLTFNEEIQFLHRVRENNSLKIRSHKSLMFEVLIHITGIFQTASAVNPYYQVLSD